MKSSLQQGASLPPQDYTVIIRYDLQGKTLAQCLSELLQSEGENPWRT